MYGTVISGLMLQSQLDILQFIVPWKIEICSAASYYMGLWNYLCYTEELKWDANDLEVSNDFA